MQKTNLKGLTHRELEEFSVSIGEPKYRGKQLFDWIYAKGAETFEEMTSLSKSLREKLSATAAIDSLKLLGRKESKGDGTGKFLFELFDGRHIESVLIPPRTAFRSPEARTEEEQKRLTLCVSTQAGCPLDCTFCATGTMGFLRNLSAGEIVDQLFQVKKTSGRRVTNLVYMGMGEPLLNYDNVMNSVEIITTGAGIAARRITVSTAGWVPGIRQMTEENRKVKLAVSLHSLDDKVRSELMPINRKYPLSVLLEATGRYYRKVKRRVTFEYILLDGRNDGEKDIDALIALSRTLPCKINIIPFHSIAFTHPTGVAAQLRPASGKRIEEFVRRLREAHITVFVRSSSGEDIDAACGQLAVLTDRKQEARLVTSRRRSRTQDLRPA